MTGGDRRCSVFVDFTGEWGEGEDVRHGDRKENDEPTWILLAAQTWLGASHMNFPDGFV